MARGLSQRRLIRHSSPFVNLELGLVGFVSASLVFLINFIGTGYIAWHASLVRLVVGVLYHLFIPKLAEYTHMLGKSSLARQFWGNFLPNTLIFGLQLPVFFALGIPRPWLSIWPFWLTSLVTFTQIVKCAQRGYEPGVWDIVCGLLDDCRRLCRRKG